MVNVDSNVLFVFQLGECLEGYEYLVSYTVAFYDGIGGSQIFKCSFYILYHCVFD